MFIFPFLLVLSISLLLTSRSPLDPHFYLIPIAIISTHGHFDHVGCVKLLKTEFNIPFYLHELDLKLCKSANFYLKIAKLDHKIESVTPDFILKGDKNSLHFNGINLTF